MHSRPRNLLSAIFTFSLASAGATALAGGFLSDDDVKRLSADPKESCLVMAQLSPKDFGNLEGPVKMLTSGGERTAEGGGGGLVAMGGFAFANVPKGPFRVTNFQYKRLDAKNTTLFKKIWDTQSFDLLGSTHGGKSGRGDVPVEMSGTCDGGFINLGFFIGEGGGLTSPGFRHSTNTVEAGNAARALKKDVKGTAWEAAIDHPAESKPLAKDFVIVVKLTAEELAKVDAANQAAVAKVFSQTRNAKAPPSDDGAVESSVGSYALASVNGNPVPYTVPANGCTWTEGLIELKGDASYTSTSTMECAGKPYAFPTSGFFGIRAGSVTYAVAVGPAVPAGVTIKLADGAITQVSGADTYVFKKK